jgi:hypothetical protein
MKVSAIRAVLLVFLFVPVAVGENQPRPLLKEFVGVNGHFPFKPELYKQVCRLARNYHNIPWDVKQPGDPPAFPLCVNRVDWNSDVYGRWTSVGFEVDICVQFEAFGPPHAGYEGLWKGREQWGYTYGYEMARYFGPSGKQRLCTSIEIGNEPGDQFDDVLFTDIFRNMARGIRAGDPQVKIVTCNAHAAPADAYTKSLPKTFASAEMKRLYDVINVHAYAFKPKAEGQSPWDRSYPEDPTIDYLKTLDAVIAWRDKEAADKEVWITEFGWDACTEAAMKNRKDWSLKLNWTGVTDLQQAQYLVRSLLCFCERGIQRAYVFNYDDADEPSVHASSGLTRRFQPKMSFWAIKHLFETLGEYRFSRIVSKAPGDLYVYEFSHGRNTNLLAWVAWSPTGSGREQEMTIRTLPHVPWKVQRMPVEHGPASNAEWKSPGDGDITVKVTESPLYIMLKN